MLDYKDIITKHYALGMSGMAIAKSLNVSPSGVNDFLRAFKACDKLGYPLPQGITNYGIAQSVYGKNPATAGRDLSFEQPDYASVEKDMSSRKNMTLKVLWNRYVKQCRDGELKFYSYRQFCENYTKWCEENKETLPCRRAVIEGLLGTGVYMLVGAPKIGKSFLVAQVAYRVSTGTDLWGYRVHGGTVLYLALEDDKKRLQERMARMFGVEGCDNLHFATHSGIRKSPRFRRFQNRNRHRWRQLQRHLPRFPLHLRFPGNSRLPNRRKSQSLPPTASGHLMPTSGSAKQSSGSWNGG